MAISEAQKQALTDWFVAKNTRERPCCHTEDQFIPVDIVTSLVHQDGTTEPNWSAPRFPVVQVVCRNCAYLMTFAAQMVGLVPPTE